MNDNDKRPRVPKATIPDLVDIVNTTNAEGNTSRAFLLKSGEVRTEIERENVTWVPVPRSETGWLLPNVGPVQAAYESLRSSSLSPQTLYGMVRNQLTKHAHLTHDGFYDLLACWVFTTYRQDWWQVFPFMFFYGAPNTGKSRIGGAATFMSYRAEMQVSPTEANIFRGAEEYDCTLVLDYEKFNQATAVYNDVILARWERGPVVARQDRQSGDGPMRRRVYHVHGPTMFLSNEPPNSGPILARTLLFPTERAQEHYPKPVAASLLAIRENLTAWRWWTLTAEQTPNESIEGRHEYKFRDNAQVLRQIAALVAPPDAGERVDAALDVLWQASRTERNYSELGDVLLAVSRVKDRYPGYIFGGRGRLPSDDILHEYRTLAGEEKANAKWLSFRLRTLGFESAGTQRFSADALSGSTRKAWAYNPEKLAAQLVEFGIDQDRECDGSVSDNVTVKKALSDTDVTV